MTGPLRIAAGDMTVDVLAFGAHLIGVRVGDSPNLVAAFDDLADYRDAERNPHLGAVAGRYANRIGGACITLDGITHRLAANDGRNTLHGGPVGFGRLPWTVVDHAPDRVCLELVSPDGDQGFPGELTARVTYSVAGRALRFEATASTTAATVVSLTNHAYWNLAGGGSIDDHTLSVDADLVVEVDDELIPTGRLADVTGTAFDLRRPGPIGDLDHCLTRSHGGGVAAELTHPPSGRRLVLQSDQPGLQVYAGLHLAAPWGRRGAVCLEPEQLPDAPNRPGFASPVLRPGGRYRHIADHHFPLPDWAP